MFRSLSSAVLAALLPAVLPAQADAKVFKGRTDQGKVVRVTTRGGYVLRTTFAWRAQCDRGPGFTSATVFRPRTWEASQTGVAIDGAYTIKGTRGYRARVIGRLRMVKAGAGYRGSYSLTTKILHNGKRLATCSHPVTFSAGAPAAPGLAKHLVGLTRQRRVVALSTGADGVIDDFRIGWQAKCGDGDVYATITAWTPPFDSATPDALQDSGTYHTHYKREHYAITQTLTAARSASPAGETWAGTLTGVVVVTVHGRVTTRCTLKPVKWSATLL